MSIYKTILSLNWKLFIAIILGFCISTLEVKAQNSVADKIAKNRKIFVKKPSKGYTIYDYDQTQMKLTPIEFVTPKGSLYFSKISLEIPDDKTTATLTLDETRIFLKRLAGIYQINKKGDQSGVWRREKTYFFNMETNGNLIYFQLGIEPTDVKLVSFASGGINGVDFTINNFNENRERTQKVIREVMEIVSKKENDLVAKLREDEIGISGYKIDYQKFYKMGLRFINQIFIKPKTFAFYPTKRLLGLKD